jgi:putative hydrolases of HD superfamily
MKNRLQQQIAFIFEIDKIKSIFRKTKLFHTDRHENDAEHSWHIAMMTLILSEHANEKIDILKVIKMLLIHDVVEIDAGDVNFYKKTDSYKADEKSAAQRIFGLLPPDQAKEYIALWLEFEEQETKEARFAAALDRLEPLLQNVHHKCEFWNANDISHDQVVEKTSYIVNGSEVLWDYIHAEIDRCLDEGLFSNSSQLS